MKDMTPLQYKMLKAINDGDFALCHLYNHFNCKISYERFKKHLYILKNFGHVYVTETNGGFTFGMTAQGRDYMKPIIY